MNIEAVNPPRVLTQQVLQQMVARQQQQQQQMAAIALRISCSSDLETVLTTAVEGVRQLLDCDRTFQHRQKASRTTGRRNQGAVCFGGSQHLYSHMA